MRVDVIPPWIDNTTKLTGDKFKKIFLFAVINFPVIPKSARAIALPDNTTKKFTEKTEHMRTNVERRVCCCEGKE